MKATSHIKHDYIARKFCLSGGGGGCPTLTTFFFS